MADKTEEIEQPQDKVEIEPPKETPEPEKEPAPEPTEEPIPDQPEPAEDEPEQPVSRRENLRIQKLVQQLREKEEAVAPEVPRGQGLDYGTALDADPEVVKQLEADRQAYGKELYLQGVQQANSIRFQTRLEVDAPRVEASHPQLDKDSAEFHPALADAVNSMYLSTVGYDPKTGSVQNPNIRYSDYVESIFELAGEIAGVQTTQAKKSIVKQVASTGLRPNGSSAKRLNLDKAPEEMTDDELKAVIGMSLK